jgi:alkanesulfonate monooxygenase SsuD/methylene tetrahydromethanopterin reductase-like flavin-dependent oxidoreductase (luciferase family)
VGRVPVIVGGSGEQRTLEIAARLGDGCNVSSDVGIVDRKREVLHRHCAELGRDPDEVALTVLDLPVVGRDREDVWSRVERLRGRTSAAAYSQRHHAGTPQQHHDRHQVLAQHGVSTVFVALPDLSGADDVLTLSPMLG